MRRARGSAVHGPLDPAPAPEAHIDSTGSRSADEADQAESDDRILKAKYHDWCSAHLAERFLQLSPDTIYALAQRAPSASAREVAPTVLSDALPEAGSEAFRELIARVTEALVEELGLPTFEQWSEAYRTDPAPFEKDLLGLWREAL